MQVSIIIVNYNTKELTLNCIESIYQHTQDIDFEIILVDNASTDGSVDAIAERFPKVKIIASDENLGFGRANNLGVKHAQGEFLFMLNSDTTFIENSLYKLYNFYENNKKLKIGVLGGILLDVYREINGCGNPIPSPKKIMLDKIRFLPLIKKIFSPIDEKKFWDLDKAYFQVGYVMGADMFIKKSLFIDVGGFDENYFMYYEETDMQYQLSKLGYRHFISTDIKIIHSEIINPNDEKVKPQTNNWRRTTIHKSQIYYMKKNFPKYYWLYKIVDYPILVLNKLNGKYKKEENRNYIETIRKSY